jgi:hypothetical protein
MILAGLSPQHVRERWYGLERDYPTSKSDFPEPLRVLTLVGSNVEDAIDLEMGKELFKVFRLKNISNVTSRDNTGVYNFPESIGKDFFPSRGHLIPFFSVLPSVLRESGTVFCFATSAMNA